MDGGMVEGNPDLHMTPQIQRELDTWRETGVYPFPSLGVDSQPSPSRYSPTDLRLIHHISSVATQMQAAEAGHSATWTKRVPMLVVTWIVLLLNRAAERLILKQVFEDCVK
jgi:hypothetical protein